MTAIITNIMDAPSVVESETAAFADYPDAHIQTRHSMLKMIKSGRLKIKGDQPALERMVFPNGYDPVNHPQDNIDAVFREGVRRGVFEAS